MQQRAVAAKAGKEATQNARALILAREREKNQEAMARVEAAEEKRREEQRFAQQYIDGGGALGRFVKFGMACRKLSTSPPFENTVLVAIMVAGGLVALNTYDGMEESMGAKVVDAIVLTIFAFEIVVKMLGEHVQFWRYFVGEEWRWNNFDFLVFLFSLPIWDAFFDGSFVLALRLMRLMRFMKIIHKIPTLRLIIEGLIGGLSAVTAISLLLFLILYLYAIVGEWWATTNTPTHQHIPRLHLLCTRATAAPATPPARPRLTSCAHPPFLLAASAGVTFFGTNDPWHFASFRTAFITLIRCATLEDWSDVMYVNYYGCDVYDNGLYVKSKVEAGIGTHLCDQPSAQAFFTVLYFVSFITLASFVMLSMFVGAITLSMAGSVELMNQEARMKVRARATLSAASAAPAPAPALPLLRRRARLPPLLTPPSPRPVARPAQEERKRIKMEKKRRSSAVATTASVGEPAPVADDWRATNKKRKVAAVLLQAWDGTLHTYDPLPDPRLQGKRSVLQLYIKLSNACRRIVQLTAFSRIVLAAIIVASILVGMETRQNPAALELEIMTFAQTVVFWIFFAELMLNICSFGLEPLRFLFGNPDRHWNRLDFMVVVLSIANVGAFIQVVRLLRLLRILRVVRSIPKLRVLVMALVNGVTSIGYISSIMFVTYFIFSILAIIFFKENDPWHFNNLHTAMMTLFRCATLEDWTDVMYIQMYGCANYAAPICTNSHAFGYFAALFFVVFVVIGSLVMLNLFVGVISTSMEQATDELEKERLLEDEVDVISAQYGVSADSMVMYREVFGLLDVDGGGSIADEELKLGLEAAGRTVSDSEVKRLVAQFDEDEDGTVRTCPP